MKILSLRFANLNSLPGPYLIRFDASPLADTGLFAITGPTGAGKSTLLDAIAVGLYGRVPRHDRQVGEMVSRQAPGAWAEVEFEVFQTNADTGQAARARYRSRWEVRRKTRGEDKGGLNQDAMTLTDCATGQTMLSGKELVPARVGELSGLDFGQFEQAVLLSQGKFARFLHAPERERSALLEKMTNVGIYSRLSVAAFEKAKEEEQQTKLLEATLQATRLLPPDERQQLETQLDELHDEAELLYWHQQELSACLAWRTIIDQLDRQLAAATREAEALALAEVRLQPELARLAGHERAEALRPALEGSDRAARELAFDAEELASLQQQLPALLAAAEAAASARTAAEAEAQQAEAEAERLRPVLQEAERQDVSLAAAQSQLAKRRAEHTARTQAHTAEHRAWQQLAAELNDLSRQQQALEAWLTKHQHEIGLGEALIEIKRDLLDLEEVNKELAKLETEQAQLLRQHETATTERQRYQQAADEAAHRQQQLAEQIRPSQQEQQALLAGHAPTHHTQQAANLLARQHLLQRLLPLAHTAEQQTQQAVTLATEHASAAEALGTAETARAVLADRHTQAQHLLDSLEREQRLQQTLADLNAHRHQLRPGEACPLCGALEHVLSADYQADANQQELRVAQQKAAVGALAAELHQHDLALERRRTEQQQRAARRHEAAAAADQARQQATALAAALAPAPPLEPTALQTALAEAEAAHAAAATTCTRLAELQQHLDALRSQHDEARDQAHAAATRATEATHQLGAVAKELAQQKATLADLREQAANYRHVVQSKLQPHQLALPAASPFAGVLATLAERAATYAKQQKALEEARQQHTSQQVAHDTSAKALAKEEDALRATTAALETENQALEAQRQIRQAHYAGPDPAAEREALHQTTQRLAQAQRAAEAEHTRQQQALGSTTERQAQRKADYARHSEALEASRHELAQALAAAGFGSAAEAQELLLPPAEAEALGARRQQHRTSQQASAQLCERLAQELTHYQEAALTPLTTATLSTDLAQLQLENERLHQRLGGVASQLHHDDQARQQLAEGATQLAARQREQQRWQDLAEQIGSARGDKFSQFAQGLTLSHLARLANLRLRQLTSRYTILKTPNRNLELQIIDHDQADTVRPMASLSGGESFLVSLALALGLSELAGYKARIESLFIDEGFGTLDPDALNTALDALERLQHTGKMIGVISHVADLKERIGTQIRVQPVSAGNSTVRVVDVAGNEQECEG